VLPLVPAYVSYVAGDSLHAVRLRPDSRARISAMVLSAFLVAGFSTVFIALGLAFGFGWTPCIGPALGAILTVSAAQSSVSGGVALLAAYALGLGVPFLLSAFFTGELIGRLKALRSLGRMLQIAAGAIMITMGLAMVTGRLTTFGFWLLETFPALGRIG